MKPYPSIGFGYDTALDCVLLMGCWCLDSTSYSEVIPLQLSLTRNTTGTDQ